jgi:hypothetical protein
MKIIPLDFDGEYSSII